MDEPVDLFFGFQSERWLEPVFSIPDLFRFPNQLFGIQPRNPLERIFFESLYFLGPLSQPLTPNSFSFEDRSGSISFTPRKRLVSTRKSFHAGSSSNKM